MNSKISLNNITPEEAETLLMLLTAKFNLVAKSYQDDNFHDVSYIKCMGFHDDNFHSYELNNRGSQAR